MWKDGQWVELLEREPGREGSSGSPDDPSSAGSPDETPKPGIPDDSFEVTLPSGDVVTYGELKQAHENNQELIRDHTRKTQEAADLKRDADEQLAEATAVKAEAAGETAQAGAIRTAVQNDIMWYNAHDVSEWAAYTPEVERLEGGDKPVNKDPETTTNSNAPTAAEITATNERVAAVEARLDKSANEVAVDATLATVGTLVGSEGHELVTRKLLVQAVQAHQSQNEGRLPDTAEVNKLAKDIQSDLADAGIPIPRGNVHADGSNKPRAVGEVASNVDPNWKNLSVNRNSRQVTDALGDVMREKAAARG